jgi:hypothetical protein
VVAGQPDLLPFAHIVLSYPGAFYPKGETMKRLLLGIAVAVGMIVPARTDDLTLTTGKLVPGNPYTTVAVSVKNNSASTVFDKVQIECGFSW